MEKQKVIITKGLPASGKSTWACELIKKEPNKWKRINKDLLREMLDGGVWSGENEKDIIFLRNELMVRFLMKGFSVIIDDTNLDPKHANAIKETVEIINKKEEGKPEFNIEVEERFFDTPVYECIERDKLRGDKSVGERVIINMWKKYLDRPVKQEYNPELPDCIIVDVDGTLAYRCDRDIFDYTKVSGDHPNENLIKIIRTLHYGNVGLKIFILSGREDSSRDCTQQWLDHNLDLERGIDGLFMRKTGDHRPDYIVKGELYEEYIKGKYNIIAVMDDRPQVINGLWKKEGLFVMDCNRHDSRIDF
jgi:predicted kinase